MRIEIADGTIFDSDIGRITLPNNEGVITVEPLLMDQHRQGHQLMDADGLIFFQRQLTLIRARSYDIKYPELKARMMFPVNNEGGPGVQQIVYRTYDQSGQARIINGYADDLPRADIHAGPENVSPVRSVGISYGYNHDEIMAARTAGIPLDARKASAAMRGTEEKINSIAYYGDASAGLTGFFTHPNVPLGIVVAGQGGSTEWSNKTAEEILFDVNDAFADVFNTTRMVEKANTLALPPAQYSFIMSHPRSQNSDTTIGQYLVANSQYLNSVNDIIPLNEAAADFNDVLTTDAMIVYRRDPEAMELEIPVELEQFPVQMRNLEYVVPCRARVGGLVIRYPLSISILTGI